MISRFSLHGNASQMHWALFIWVERAAWYVLFGLRYTLRIISRDLYVWRPFSGYFMLLLVWPAGSTIFPHNCPVPRPPSFPEQYMIRVLSDTLQKFATKIPSYRTHCSNESRLCEGGFLLLLFCGWKVAYTFFSSCKNLERVESKIFG